jgi:histidine ammonia-lyase
VADPVTIVPASAAGGPTVEDIVAIARERRPIALSAAARGRIEQSRAVVDRHVAGELLVYGLNTGLGHMRDERVPLETLMAYQVGIITGHGGALGEPLPVEDVRALMAARVVGAAQGGSGLHPASVDLLCELLNRGVHPVVPCQGSVGAADLMHLAEVALVMIGRGHASVGGSVLPGAEALAAVGLEPYRPLPKEGLALISANAASIGIGALVVEQADVVATLADLAGALSLEALRGHPGIYREDVARAKPFPGQIAAAASIRAILEGTDLTTAGGASVQDPLSFRVMPQVHGALRDQLATTRAAVEVELGSASDNPLVATASGELVSNGNFQPIVLALAFEGLRLSLAHVGLLSERRSQKSFAAWFRTRGASGPRGTGGAPGDPSGRQEAAASGRLLAIYAAAADLAELRHLARPVSLDCPPLDLDIEDHATLAPTAVLYARRSLALLEEILAVEILAAISVLEPHGERRHGQATAPLVMEVRRVLDGLEPDAGTAAAVAAVRSVASDAARTLTEVARTAPSAGG